LLGRFHEEHPDVAVRLRVRNTLGVVHMVENNDIDLGIVEGPVNNKNLVNDALWHDELVLACPAAHTLASRTRVKAEDLLQYPFISREEGSGTRAVTENYFKQCNVSFADLNITMELGSPESIKSAVEAGLGIAILSIATLEKELKLGSLAAVSLEPKITRPFSIVYQRQQFRMRAIEEFIKFVEARRSPGLPD
jgi:DNA-binding transcriptional LysR family regulator